MYLAPHVTLCLALIINSYSVLIIIIENTFLRLLLEKRPPFSMVVGATLAVCRAKAAPSSFLSYFKTLSIGPVPGIKPMTSAVKHYALPTELILLQLTSRIFNIGSCTCFPLASL